MVSDVETTGYSISNLWDSGSVDSATGTKVFRGVFAGINEVNYTKLDVYLPIAASQYPNWESNKTGICVALGIEIDT